LEEAYKAPGTLLGNLKATTHVSLPTMLGVTVLIVALCVASI
jgi:hypothetical protein